MQTAYHEARLLESSDIDRDIFEAMQVYLTGDLGLSPELALQRAAVEIDRKIPKSVIDALVGRGIPINGATVLDLGAGLGGVSEELVLRGASVLSLEPGGAWAKITQRRVSRHGANFTLLNAFGESIPLQDASVDLIISLQVLEHVKDPAKVLSEAFRVLKPGGHFLLACENYLAFWEGHYRLPWLPLFPKSLAKIYLSMNGRSSKFLTEAVTYITFPGVINACRKLGFIRARDKEIEKSLNKNSLKWQFLKVLGSCTGGAGPILLDDMRNTFKFGINELLQKPFS